MSIHLFFDVITAFVNANAQFVAISEFCNACKMQELSYRKQIARKLRTQYVEGINSDPVTLESRLRFTQGH